MTVPLTTTGRFPAAVANVRCWPLFGLLAPSTVVEVVFTGPRNVRLNAGLPPFAAVPAIISMPEGTAGFRVADAVALPPDDEHPTSSSTAARAAAAFTVSCPVMVRTVSLRPFMLASQQESVVTS